MSLICDSFSYRFLDKAAIVAEGDSAQNPWKLSSVTRVEEVKMVARLLPVWATTILFWTIYAQMITFSVVQASTMERSIGSFQIPAGSLTVFFVAAILITLGVYDRLIMPLWKKWKGKQGKLRSNHKILIYTQLEGILRSYVVMSQVSQTYREWP